ncbi:disease resistance protein L6-like isoform X2 [Syzygium oleosum]|uniref:disease resistance protein L6-like isoform X2 n=1 Tax=Syzygium oleosum TaxID=219896 RepID=UPI0024BA5172|nr:disease resistance protein L6-like isoform X2 [Syzygium oleosum]
MANSEAGTNSDVARQSGGEYQVFLSFRGPDTRNEFTDFLYHGLEDVGVRVFRDEDELRVGEVIGENILRAIDNSIIYIPIFSPTYASSKWCLRELVHIRHNLSRPEGQKSIFPIFFHVEPDDIKLKTQRYIEDFLRHEKESPKEVEAWREALVKVDEIKGWKVKKDQSQASIVKLVVEKVLGELRIKQKSVPEHLIGLDDQVEDLTELLDVNQLDVRLIGIYGMGGMGKTTIAKVVFNKLCSYFGKCCSFLEDVRERSTKESIVQLQKKLLSDIVGSGSVEKVEDSEQGMRTIGEALCNKKVLVVLDDVDNKEHIKKLIGNSNLHLGSRIIITTRDTSILKVGGFKGEIQEYEMIKMDDALALQLFCWHAFGRDFPLDDYRGLSSKIVSLMGGLPLAIEVVGSLLKGKDEDFWKETLERLSEEPEEKILEKLKISFDDLEDGQKQIFLDIACFLFNEKKTDATYMWADSKFYPKRGIEVLTKRCLIKVLDNGRFWMHNQLIDLGRHIVRQESPFNPGKRSRLWVAEEALEIIRTKKWKDKVQAIKIDGVNESIEITNEEFERLQNLRLLNLGNGTYAADFAKCCSKLRWISWHSPNWDLMGDNVYSNHLVVFKLHDTGFMDNAKAWDMIKRARNLKVLSLTQCGGITKIPNFSKSSGLERLTLEHCDKLKRIESFVGDIKSLIELEIEWCEGLTDLPEEVGALVKLKRLSLRGCSRLRELPCSLGNLTSLIELDLSKTGIAKLPNSMKGLLKLESFLLTDTAMMGFPKFIEKLRSLRVLGLPKNGSYSPRRHVWQLPSGINMSEILEELDLSGPDEMTDEIPVGIGDLSSFKILNLNSTQICEIPRNIDMLHHLQTLNLRNCHDIQGSSELPTRTINILHQHAASPPELVSLSRLDLKTLVQLPCSLLRLELLCSSFRWAELLPSSLILRNLMTLEFYYVEVEDIPLDRLPGLESLTIDGCELLQQLTISSENLRQAHVSSCPDLVDISISFSESLESFFGFGCASLETMNWLDCMRNLEKLEIQQCAELTDVCGLEHLVALKSLKVRACTSLRRCINPSCTNIPDDCLVEIQGCGDFFKDSTPSGPPGMPLLRYILEILLDTSNKDELSCVSHFPNMANQAPVDEDGSFGVTGNVNNPLKRRRKDEEDKEGDGGGGGGERASWGDGNCGSGGSVGENLTSLVLPDEEEKHKGENFFIESLQGKASLESNSHQGVRAKGDYYCHIQALYDDANEIEMSKNKRVSQSGATTTVAAAAAEGESHALLPSVGQQGRLWVKDRPKELWERCNSPEFPEKEFWRNFRMSKATFDFICNELDAAVTENSMLREAIPVRQRVAVCVWRLATGEPLHLVSNKFGLGMSTCHKLIREVCSAIRKVLMPKFLQWPDEHRLAAIKDEFEAASGIPLVCGAMYTTHVPIIAPKISVASYLNRQHTERNKKTTYSITVQGVVDPRGVFLDVCIGWPGSMTDDQVLEKSALYQRAGRGLLKDVWVVGNPGHPLMDWVLVPYTHQNITWTQHGFNQKLAEVQGVAREAFARLKGRWACLQKPTEVKLQDLPVVLGACCVLHNICEARNEAMDSALRFEIFDDEMVPKNPIRSANAAHARDQIAYNL